MDYIRRLSPNEWLVIFAIVAVLLGVGVQAFANSNKGGKDTSSLGSKLILGVGALLLGVGGLHMAGVIHLPLP